MNKHDILRIAVDGTAVGKCYNCDSEVTVPGYEQERKTIIDLCYLDSDAIRLGWPHILCSDCYTNTRLLNQADLWKMYICAAENKNTAAAKDKYKYTNYDYGHRNGYDWYGRSVGFSSYCGAERSGLAKLRRLVKKYNSKVIKHKENK